MGKSKSKSENVILETGRAGGTKHNFPHPNQLLLFCFVGNVWWLRKSTEEKKISSRGKYGNSRKNLKKENKAKKKIVNVQRNLWIHHSRK